MSQSNQILTCIVDGMRPDRPPAIRGAAARALINSLDFTRSNFEAQQERDVIMQVWFLLANAIFVVACFPYTLPVPVLTTCHTRSFYV